MTASRGMRTPFSALMLVPGLVGLAWGAEPPQSSDPARASQADHGSPEGAFHQSPLLHRRQRQGDLPDGVSYLEQLPGLGDEWHDPALDFTAYVKMLVEHNHNFTLLWATELPAFRGLPTTASSPPDFTRDAAALAADGPGQRVGRQTEIRSHEIQSSVLRPAPRPGPAAQCGWHLRRGLSLQRRMAPPLSLPRRRISPHRVEQCERDRRWRRDPVGDDDGAERHHGDPGCLREESDRHAQRSAERPLDRLPGGPRRLEMVERPPDRARRAPTRPGKPLQHPIGYGALDGQQDDDAIINSDADWIAPSARISPTTTCGSGHPSCKVNINDSDHSYFGIWNDSPQVNRNYFWINFTNGNQTLFMDPYVVYYPRERRNLCPSPVNGIGSGPDPRWENVRDTMGYIRDLCRSHESGRHDSAGEAVLDRSCPRQRQLGSSRIPGLCSFRRQPSPWISRTAAAGSRSNG